MQTEFEVKILEINVEEIQKKLEVLGAKKIADKFQKRYVYDFKPKKPNSWIRLRTDGNKTTLCIKEIHNDGIEGTKEVEVEVSDFEKTHIMLESIGYSFRAYQENKRISYTLDDVEVEIDFWPQIPPYLEIEGENSKEVYDVALKLGLDKEKLTSINTKKVYQKYGIENVDFIRELKF